MARKKFSTEQISQALKNLESGTAAAAITRKLGIHENTLYRWKKLYGQLGTPEMRELRLLRDENTKLKQMVADLSLDRKMLQDVLSKRWRSRRHDARSSTISKARISSV